MQAGFLLSKTLGALVSDALTEDEFAFVDSFDRGLQEYYDTYMKPESIAYSVLASVTSLASGKYNYVSHVLGGIALGVFLKDKEKLPEDVRKDMELWGKGMYIQPIDFEKDALLYGLGKFHPVLSEMMNAIRLIYAATDFGEDYAKGDAEFVEAAYLINAMVRYIYVNPVSNIIHTELSKARRGLADIKKRSSSNKIPNDNDIDMGVRDIKTNDIGVRNVNTRSINVR